MQAVERMPHPARYSAEVLPIMGRWLAPGSVVLDPFAGTGERAETISHVRWVRVELEEGWADMIQGDALTLPFRNGTFDAVATSCTYGNRMADHQAPNEICKKCAGTGIALTRNPGDLHETCEKCGGSGRNKYTRITYRHKLERMPRPQSSAILQWGPKYRAFHEAAWTEAKRVLRPSGRLVLNVSDHVRARKVQPVVRWHIETLGRLGFTMVRHEKVATKRMGFGQNGELRVPFESVILFGL